MPSILQMFKNAQDGDQLLPALLMLFKKRQHIKNLQVAVLPNQSVSLNLTLDGWAHLAGHNDTKIIFKVREANPHAVKQLLERIWKNSIEGLPPTMSDAQKLFCWTEYDDSSVS